MAEKYKPEVDVSLCSLCGQMTDKWKSDGKSITWKCDPCVVKEIKEGQERLELVLEKMCDKH